MTTTEISVISACASTAISILSAGWMVMRHCINDAEKEGMQAERSRVNSERISELERLQRGER